MIVPDDQAKVSPTSITSFFSYSSSLSPLLFFSFWPLSALFSNKNTPSSQVIFTDTSVPPLPSLFTETELRHMYYSFIVRKTRRFIGPHPLLLRYVTNVANRETSGTSCRGWACLWELCVQHRRRCSPDVLFKNCQLQYLHYILERPTAKHWI